MTIRLLFAILLGTASLCFGQPFRNLDFQAPHITRLNAPVVDTADAIPGWQLSHGNSLQNQMYYNTFCQTCAAAGLFGPVSPQLGDAFEFEIFAGILPGDPSQTPVSESVFQTGAVPNDAQSLLFLADIGPNISLLHVSLGGQSLNPVVLEDLGTRVLVGADVTKWAGMNTELRFTVEPGGGPVFANTLLKDIQFSAETLPLVPEPSTLTLLLIGLGSLYWSRRSRQ